MSSSMFGGDGVDGSNAAVGNNGWVDLSTYSKGFNEAVEFLCTAALMGDTSIDCLIYPIIFNARHRVELFIKSELKNIGSIRAGLAVPDERITKTHDLKILWDTLVDKYHQCDKRYTDLVGFCDPVINEIHKIDPKGETFRYPYGQDGIKHLKDQSIIGVKRFSMAYRSLTENLNKIESLSNYLVLEYATGTHTKKLSRKDLEDIAIDLPDRKTWGDPTGTFDTVRNRHIARYGLSSREYSEALDKIKEHRQFSIFIGVELPIEHCDASKLLKIFAMQINLNSCCHDLKFWTGEYDSFREKYVNFLENNLSNEELATVLALYELTNCKEFSEYFDFNFTKWLKIVKSDRESKIIYLSGKSHVAEFIKKSLEKLGQKSLLERIGNVMVIAPTKPCISHLTF